jgi:protein O-GlcNAc transferase
MPSSVDSIFKQAFAAFQAGKLDDAERHFKQTLHLQPANIAALNILAIILTRLQKYGEAQHYFETTLGLDSSSDATFYNFGIVLKALGKPTEALRRFSQALNINRGSAEAWNNRGTVFNDIKDYDSALRDFDEAIKLNPRYSEAFCNKAKSLVALKRYDQALAAFDKALVLKPDLPEAWAGRGAIFTALKCYDQALAALDRALALGPDFDEAWIGRASICTKLKRLDEALSAYDKALALKPNLAEAWVGRGNVCTALNRDDEAIAAYDKALALKPNLAEAWVGHGNIFVKRKHYDEAVAAFDRALTLNPDLAESWIGRGSVYTKLSCYADAFAAYDKAIALNPELAEAWIGRGNISAKFDRLNDAAAAYGKALELKPDLAEVWLAKGGVLAQLKRHDEALVAYDKALALKPNLAEAWVSRGNVFQEIKRADEAFVAYDKALALRPNIVGAEGARLHAKMQMCDWSDFDSECRHLIAAVQGGALNTPPFPFLTISSSAEAQFKCAKLCIANDYPPSESSIWQSEYYSHERIRIAYLSADFFQHATSVLMAGMFACHNKSRFEVTAISIGSADGSEMRKRLEGSFDRFIDAATYSDDQIAKKIRELEIDILVDLKGFTGNARTNILSKRPAPIQVSYLGYPGTMGAPYIDYIIADSIVIPEDQRRFYSEKIVRLPNSYQVNSGRPVVSDKPVVRAELGLPPTGFVFCCFNNNYKITPRVFDSWMRILNNVDGSVLWLLGDNASAVYNLRKEALKRGVSAERLIMAERAPLQDHLARHRAADLFLDTLPYNAHTTASDALWAGLPVLTCIGETFAGRVAASLLNAIRLPELIATTSEIYEQMAVDLAMNPEKMAIIKRKLADNRLTTPLFDTELFTRHIEAAFTAMHERHRAALGPDHLTIAP